MSRGSKITSSSSGLSSLSNLIRSTLGCLKLFCLAPSEPLLEVPEEKRGVFSGRKEVSKLLEDIADGRW